MSQLEIEDESSPCIYEPCPGLMTPELDGDCVTWQCGTCGNETYTPAAGPADACQAGVPVAAQQPGPVFLGPVIPRRPQ